MDKIELIITKEPELIFDRFGVAEITITWQEKESGEEYISIIRGRMAMYLGEICRKRSLIIIER